MGQKNNVYECPQQFRTTHANFLMCKSLMQEGASYNTQHECIQAICAHQYNCRITNRWENTNTREAKECPLLNRLETKTES